MAFIMDGGCSVVRRMIIKAFTVLEITFRSTVLRYNFEVLVLYLCISLFCYFTHTFILLCCISEADIVLYTPLHLFDNFSYFADSDH